MLQTSDFWRGVFTKISLQIYHIREIVDDERFYLKMSGIRVDENQRRRSPEANFVVFMCNSHLVAPELELWRRQRGV